MEKSIRDSTIQLLKVISEEMKDDKMTSEIIDSKQEVIDRYSPIFQNENINKLNKDDFLSFLNFKNNKHWGGLNRNSGQMVSDIDTLKSALFILTNENEDLGYRFYEAMLKINGLGTAKASAILQMNNPDKYGIWNDISERTMKLFKLWPDNVNGDGQTYVEMNKILNHLKDELSLDLWSLDAMWFYLHYAAKNRIISKLATTDDYKSAEQVLLNKLLKKVIEGYNDVTESIINDVDFEAIIYLLTTESKEGKKERIRKSNIDSELMNEVFDIIDELHNNYDKHNFVLLRPQNVIDNWSKSLLSNSAVKIIKLGQRINNLQDENAKLEIVEKCLQQKIDGLGIKTLSLLLHSLDPEVFPILESKGNYFSLLEYLGIGIKSVTKENNYISNTRKLKKFRDENCTFKNYMTVMDISGYMDNIIDLFQDTRGGFSIESTEPKNIIFFGPPGTGKTYETVNRALKIIDGKKFENARERNTRFIELEKEGRVKFVTFHQSYGYEEFIEGIRPVMNSNDNKGEISYKIQDGIFKEFCNRALNITDAGHSMDQEPDKRFVFIIDEINRGNISRIFGELITLVETSKRIGSDEAMKAELPYSREKFGVPDNVYVIGTMNTADRSLVKLDAALRRRFHFEEMKPNSDLVPEFVGGINLRKVFDTINSRIEDLYDADHTIGHSYFMDVKDMEQLNCVFKNNVLPLLQEYFHDDLGKVLYILSKKDDGSKSDFIHRKEGINMNGYRGAPKYQFKEILNEESYQSLYS